MFNLMKEHIPHKGISYIRLWLRRQFLLAGTIHHWILSSHGIN